MKKPSELQRLARAFTVRKASKRLPVLLGTGAAVIGAATPFGFVMAGAFAIGMGASEIEHRRKVKRGLTEVERWGFPVVGYRDWLLAEEPTFDIELARDLDPDVLITSAKAVEPSVRVSRVRERTFQIVTRRSALPPERGELQAVLVGDRELLITLHEQLLAPLHADVGIRRMQMGDRTRMPALQALLPAGDTGSKTEDREGMSMGAFRDAALAAPPALQALVYSVADREMPREARTLKNRSQRVVYATGSTPHGVGTVTGFAAGGLFAGLGWVGPIGMAIGAVVGVGAGVMAAVNGNKRNAARIAASLDNNGFPIEGYDDWLISGRPIFDITLAAPLAPETFKMMLDTLPRAWSISTNGEVSWVVEIAWLEDKVVRLETRPALVEPPNKVEPFYGGSHQMFETFRTQVLASLHRNVGVVSVQMGGYLTRRV